ncbi:MAG: hypothetical protein FWD47_06560 [Treponema sp.]|nr:hypothetical protein [Treponema sp.]
MKVIFSLIKMILCTLVIFILFIIAANLLNADNNKQSGIYIFQIGKHTFDFFATIDKVEKFFVKEEIEYRLVEHITNDLTPILKQVAELLEYNNYRVLNNWVFSENISDHQLGVEVRRMMSVPTKNDMDGNGVIDCVDFALLFYQIATEAKFDVRIIFNSNKNMNHAFNAVRRTDNTWQTIEPQAGNGGMIIMNNAWGDKYDPTFDVDVTQQMVRRYLR